MRKLTAIILLLVFTFNMVGYRWYFNYKAQTADIRLEQQLDQQAYNDNDLILIKQPTQLPYYSGFSDFRRMYGEINVDGTIYTYVKYRVYNGVLELLCIPNHEKMQVQSSANAFAKLTGEFQTNTDAKKKNDQSQKQAKQVLSDFEITKEWAASNRAPQQILHQTAYLFVPSNPFKQCTEQPPEC